MSTKRVFLSLTIPPEIKSKILLAVEPISGVHWHPENNLHITVKFIGDIYEDQEELLISLLDYMSTQFSPINVKFIGFKKIEGRLRLIAENNSYLQSLYLTAVHNLKKIDLYSQDRITYEPHVTLGLGENVVIPRSEIDLNSLSFVANTLTLYQTIMGKGTAEYQPLHRVTLAKSL